MAQMTAKTVEDVLQWIETTPHHRASWRTKDGRDYALLDDPSAVFVLEGYRQKLRIPLSVQEQTRDLIEPGGKYDNRMYRANKAGRARLRRKVATLENPNRQTGAL